MPACLISTIQVHPARCCLDCHPVSTQTVVFASCDRLCASACLSLRLAAVKLVPRFGNIREGGMSSNFTRALSFRSPPSVSTTPCSQSGLYEELAVYSGTSARGPMRLPAAAAPIFTM
jgi:hypothetical protein